MLLLTVRVRPWCIPLCASRWLQPGPRRLARRRRRRHQRRRRAPLRAAMHRSHHSGGDDGSRELRPHVSTCQSLRYGHCACTNGS